ncbi:hypothetical protein [Novosphingobium sp.]|uniref:hypothetical protein n=1 Tax=Novosphingobium sp. TaxID=1874826 RepID=UPI002FE0ADD0
MTRLVTARDETDVLELTQEVTADPRIDDLVEQRVAQRLRSEAVHWRLRLVVTETCMMGVLVFAAGSLLGHPAMLVLRASLMVAGSCLATGVLLVGLSAGTMRLADRIRRRLGR